MNVSEESRVVDKIALKVALRLKDRYVRRTSIEVISKKITNIVSGEISMEIDREFRKIPSLNFLYEVSEDGRIVRNVKSKKQLKQIKDKGGYYRINTTLKKSQIHRTVHSLVAECWLGEKPEGYEIDHIDRNSLNNHYKNLRYVTKSEQMKNRDYGNLEELNKAKLEKAYQQTRHPLKLIKDGNELIFESQTAAARWLATKIDKSVEQIRDKFKRKRAHTYGYDVIYLNLETVRVRSTEQETVQ